MPIEKKNIGDKLKILYMIFGISLHLFIKKVYQEVGHTWYLIRRNKDSPSEIK